MATAVLNWNPNQEPDLAGYKIFRQVDHDPETLLAVVGRVTSYTDATAPEQGTATYRLKAFDLAGNESDLSAAVSKTFVASPTPPPPPPNPLEEQLTILAVQVDALTQRVEQLELFKRQVLQGLCVTTKSTLRDMLRKTTQWSTQWCS